MFSLKKLKALKGTGERIDYLIDCAARHYADTAYIIEKSSQGVRFNSQFGKKIFEVKIGNSKVREIGYYKDPKNFSGLRVLQLSNSMHICMAKTSLVNRRNMKRYTRICGRSYITGLNMNGLEKTFRLYHTHGVVRKKLLSISMRVDCHKSRTTKYEKYSNCTKQFEVMFDRKKYTHSQFTAEERFHLKLTNPDLVIIPQVHLDKILEKGQLSA